MAAGSAPNRRKDNKTEGSHAINSEGEAAGSRPPAHISWLSVTAPCKSDLTDLRNNDFGSGFRRTLPAPLPLLFLSSLHSSFVVFLRAPCGHPP